MTEAFEAAVVGGGLAGRAAAIAVARAGLRTLHLAPAAPPDRRTSALMAPSVAHLEALGVIGDPVALAQPLERIRIIDATSRLVRAPETLFDSAEAGLPAFGWNFPNIALAAALEQAAAGLDTLVTRPEPATDVTADPAGWRLGVGSDTVTVPLLIGADGRKSAVRAAAGIAVREHAFDEAALVADLTLGRPLEATSVEFHYPHGPFTLVPAGGSKANLVWIDRRETLEAARAGGDIGLVAALTGKSQRLFGALALNGPAVIFPLSTLAAQTAGRDGAVLLGEAAHAFPPIGAQGLNLGLRDVADLAAVLTETDRTAPGWAVGASIAYARRREGDLSRTTAMVDALFRSLLMDMLPAQALRAGGLWALKLSPGLRRSAFALGMGRA